MTMWQSSMLNKAGARCSDLLAISRDNQILTFPQFWRALVVCSRCGWPVIRDARVVLRVF